MNLDSSNAAKPAGDTPAPARLVLWLCLALALGTAALYSPITRHPFIHFDDDDYIIGNNHVTSGLQATNVVWAFTTSAQANWHPLTWISHQADCTLFALNPGGHHLVNLLYHVANTLLLFLFLLRATGAHWRAAVVAALFAWHPMHVESVAWASERKDVLSTFFWLLSMLAYLEYARHVPGASGGRTASRGRAGIYYAASLAACACGLMSKPMVVTLPCVLLLLDLWPLNRIGRWPTVYVSSAPAACAPVTLARLLLEKVPFLGLAAGGSVATYLVQAGAGAVAGLPLGERLANAVLAYARYVAKLFWPTDLPVIYPHPSHWPAGLALGAVALLLVWTSLCLYRLRQVPYMAVGWFWFLGTLVPTIGLIQVGAQAMADRYTYIPSIGLFIGLVWGLAEYAAARDFQWRQPVLAGLAGVTLAGCLGATAHQIAYWQDSITLFRHAVDVTDDNYAAENGLGKAYELAGNANAALACYELSVKSEPRFPTSQFNLALALLERGQTEAALSHLQAAARLQPRDPVIQYDLALYFSQQGSWTNAATCFSNSVLVRPEFAAAQLGWGGALANMGQPQAAAEHLRQALRLDPGLLTAKTNLERLLQENPTIR